MSQWIKILNVSRGTNNPNSLTIKNVGTNICATNPTNCLRINDVRKPVTQETWDIGIEITEPNQSFSIGIRSQGDESRTIPDITIDWGDGSAPSRYFSIEDVTRIYALPGNYTVKISGSMGKDGNLRIGRFANDAARVISTSVIPNIPGFNYATKSFSNCINLTSIPENLFSNNIIFDFIFTFEGCSSLTSIPSGLFANNSEAYDFSLCFVNCSSLNFIPSNLFANNTIVSSFDSCFRDCSSLTSIPANLFVNNIAVYNFDNCFKGCTSLTSIPAELFANNILANKFQSCFSEVTLNTTSYSNLLINMASNAASRPNNVLFGGGNSKYNLEGQTARQILEAKGWVFTDLGLQ